MPLNFIHVGFGVIEFFELVVIHLTSDEACWVFTVNFCYLFTHNSYRIRGAQLKSALVIGVASTHFERDEVQNLTDSLGRNREEERHHRVKSDRYTVT